MIAFDGLGSPGLGDALLLSASSDSTRHLQLRPVRHRPDPYWTAIGYLGYAGEYADRTGLVCLRARAKGEWPRA
jgi:hypothetical protein